MKNLILVGTLFLLITVETVSQQAENIREEVSMHLNSSSLITGETLYFSAFVWSAQTGKVSSLSSILYVELVNESGTVVSQQKVPLNEGRGQGDIFMTSLINSGAYQLIAYTRWMRNFGDFYHHSVQIINPFEEYHLPEPSENLTVSFYPEGGRIIPDVENTIVVKVTDYLGKGYDYQARIVTDDGDNVSGFGSIEDGVGRFTMVPEVNSRYRMIIEDQLGNFQFFDLPKAEPGVVALSVKEQGGSLLMQVKANTSNQETLNLMAYRGQDLIHKQEVIPNANFSVTKGTLGQGVVRFIVMRDGEKVSERLRFVYPETGVLIEEKKEKYYRRSGVSYPVNIPEGAAVSVSVKRVYGSGAPNHGVKSDLLLNGVEERYRFKPEYLYNENYKELLDNLLIMSSWKWEGLDVPGTVKLLPDHRGEIVSGKLNLPDSISSTEEQFIGFSIIGPDYQVKLARVKDDGRFATVITPFYGDRTAYISSMSGLSSDFIEVDSPFLETHPELTFPKITIDSIEVKELVDRSIRNQIENAYFEFKEDSIVYASEYPEEFGNFEYFYVLDQYNRFPTIKDSFVEYIPTIAARQRRSGSELKLIAPKYVLTRPILNPLVFLDGLPVTAEKILAFSPYRIESIGVIHNRYFMGPVIADGIISFRTKEGDLQGFSPGENSRKMDYLGLSNRKEYTFPGNGDMDRAEASLDPRIPDFRDQLFWDPNVKITTGEPHDLKFYTSDTTGEFEIAIEGFTDSGKPISIRKYFIVE